MCITFHFPFFNSPLQNAGVQGKSGEKTYSIEGVKPVARTTKITSSLV